MHAERLPDTVQSQFMRLRNVVIPELEKELQSARNDLSNLRNAQLQSDAVWTWPALESEGKLLWEALRRISLREGSLTLSLQFSGLGALYGRSEKSGRRAYEGAKGILVAGLIVERDRVAGRVTFELQDPLAVQRARLARESDEQLEFDMLQQVETGPRSKSSTAGQSPVVPTAVVESQPPSHPDEAGDVDVSAAKDPAVVDPQPPLSPHRDIGDIVAQAQRDMDMARDRGTAGDLPLRQISETSGGCGPTTARGTATTADQETRDRDQIEGTATGTDHAAVSVPKPPDSPVNKAIEAAWQALRGRLPAPTAGTPTAEWIGAALLDLVADDGVPKGLALDVGWAYVEGDVVQKDLTDWCEFLVRGRDSKGDSIESRGGYLRRSIVYRCREILGRRSDRGPAGSGEAIKRIVGGPPRQNR